MLSIGQFASAASVTPRAIRHYESLGLISALRGDNNYRYYDRSQLDVIAKIRDLQKLGFSLEEMRDVLTIGMGKVSHILQEKFDLVEKELSVLEGRRDRLKKLLFIATKIQSSQTIDLYERRMYMDAVKGEVLSGIRSRVGMVKEHHLNYLDRERGFYDTAEKSEFIFAVRDCILFAKKHNLTLGPGRGSCPASLILYGMGFTGIDPTRYDLFPERLFYTVPDIHIDVEFEKGQPFVDYCRNRSENLTWGKITAFKMPLLDIINNVNKKLDKPIDFCSIADDDESVLKNIRSGEIEKIFLFDYSPTALVMKYENYFQDFVGIDKIKEYLTSQKIYSFRDMVNIISLWRPNHEENIARLERYKRAKVDCQSYDFLSPDLQIYLEPNFGLIIYHEDLIKIISSYTGWDFGRCSRLRRDIRLGNPNDDLELFKKLVSREVYNLVEEESPWTFCKSHAMSFA
ncbi:MAG: MerR family transcriptional regulator [Bdellovibrionota bacterium]